MTREQLDQIPDNMLKRSPHGATILLDFLNRRGWRMSLLDLDTERRRRGIGAKRAA